MNPLTHFKKTPLLRLLIGSAFRRHRNIPSRASPSNAQSGVTSVTIANGTFADIDVYAQDGHQSGPAYHRLLEGSDRHEGSLASLYILTEHGS